MDLTYVMSFIESLEDTWLGEVIYCFASAFFVLMLSKFIIPFCKLVMFCNVIRNIEKYIEFSLLRDFPDFVKTEKSAKWLEKVRLWFIRNS